MTETAVDAPPATRREWLGLAVLALPTVLSAMDFSVLFLALPRLGADLRPSSGQLPVSLQPANAGPTMAAAPCG
jgi:DHA2 family multidrug resistance protein-like MFS transporter